MSIWFFVVPFALAAALPGPAQGALIAQVLSRGGKATLPFVFGMVFGNVAWLLAAIFGLSALALRFVVAFIVVKWLGVAYLLVLAWKLWTSAPAAEEARAPSHRGLVAGTLLTLGNPKAVLFFGAVLPHAFDMTSLSISRIALMIALGLGIDLGVQLAYVAAAARARAFVRSPRHVKRVNRSAAGLMVGSAALIATRT
ncbi:MAG TPA: LysE family translocator [Labilithrix sp.]|jgi:threonine/homoserine/homoserine lactone efflux protein|nr:LysE family translocator [Labilithrix sp.]